MGRHHLGNNLVWVGREIAPDSAEPRKPPSSRRTLRDMRRTLEMANAVIAGSLCTGKLAEVRNSSRRRVSNGWGHRAAALGM